MNKKKFFGALLALLVLLDVSLTLVLFSESHPLRKHPQKVKYTLYVGLNDKDTYRQEIGTEEAIAIIREACEAHVNGYTLQEASGFWVDEKDKETKEKTILCIFYDTDGATVHQIADVLIQKLNQNCILIEKDVMEEYCQGK